MQLIEYSKRIITQPFQDEEMKEGTKEKEKKSAGFWVETSKGHVTDTSNSDFDASTARLGYAC